MSAAGTSQPGRGDAACPDRPPQGGRADRVHADLENPGVVGLGCDRHTKGRAGRLSGETQRQPSAGEAGAGWTPTRPPVSLPWTRGAWSGGVRRGGPLQEGRRPAGDMGGSGRVRPDSAARQTDPGTATALPAAPGPPCCPVTDGTATSTAAPPGRRAVPSQARKHVTFREPGDDTYVTRQQTRGPTRVSHALQHEAAGPPEGGRRTGARSPGAGHAAARTGPVSHVRHPPGVPARERAQGQLAG